MIVFYSKEKNAYVSTNYKVMYSTLYYSEGLEQVRYRNLYARKIMERAGFLPVRKHYLLTRNPLRRLESFFKNKFRENIHHILNGDKNWEPSQQIFFDFLNISKTDSDKTKAEKFLKCSFYKFISALPEVYQNDGHLTPQSNSSVLKMRKIGITLFTLSIKFDGIYKMEKPLELSELAAKLAISLKEKKNKSATNNTEILWTSKEVEIVSKTYESDFKNFNYKPQP